jgi:hypothetical protein
MFGSLPPRLRQLLPALLALAVAAEIFAYAGYGAVRRTVAGHTVALADRIRTDDGPLRRRLHELTSAQGQDGAERGSDATAFLRQVNAAAGRTGVQLVRLVPHPKEQGLLEVELIASFPEFLRFAADMEILNSAFSGLQINPLDNAGSSAARRALTFMLEVPRRPARTGKYVDAVRAAVAAAGLRNVFTTDKGVGDGLRDLSAKYHLTGVTLIGSTAVATIDGRDYELGDKLQDMTVTAITEGLVTLAAGQQRYVIHFSAKAD